MQATWIVDATCPDKDSLETERSRFAPSQRHDPGETIVRIHERAETITPFLEEILHHKSASPPVFQSLR